MAMNRIDPSGPLYMKTEDKAGGPTDPIYSFEENLDLLFGSRYPDYTQHPMFSYLT